MIQQTEGYFFLIFDVIFSDKQLCRAPYMHTMHGQISCLIILNLKYVKCFFVVNNVEISNIGRKK